jgi:hypothetical protein
VKSRGTLEPSTSERPVRLGWHCQGEHKSTRIRVSLPNTPPHEESIKDLAGVLVTLLLALSNVLGNTVRVFGLWFSQTMQRGLQWLHVAVFEHYGSGRSGRVARLEVGAERFCSASVMARQMIAGLSTLLPRDGSSESPEVTPLAVRNDDAARPAPESRRSGPTPAAGSAVALDCLSPMPSACDSDDNIPEILEGAGTGFAR